MSFDHGLPLKMYGANGQLVFTLALPTRVNLVYLFFVPPH
jgi:hypothetical protein